MKMDWKDILSQKINSGEIEREEYVEKSPSLPSESTELIKIILDKKGRKGKIATLIVGFTCDDNRLKEIASILKSKLSTGGSARGGEILLQGDRKTDVAKVLGELGFKIK